MRRPLITFAIVACAMTVVAHANAQDGTTALPQNYKVVLDNNEMQVVHVHYEPHEALAVHDHSLYPTVYVYLSNSGAVRYMHDGATPFTLTRRPVKTGWFRVSPGRIEKHEVANLAATASDFLRVECKRISLGQIAKGFRYSQDVDLTKNSATTDYSSPEMVIRRYVITAGGVKHVPAGTPGELLIALTPAVVHERGSADQKMAAGSVLWIGADTDFDLRPADVAAAHVLAIRLLK